MTTKCPLGHEVELEPAGQLGKTMLVKFHPDDNGGLCKWSGAPLPPKPPLQRIVVPPGRSFIAWGKRWPNNTESDVIVEFDPNGSG